MFPLPTLKEFLDNPMGKGSTAISNRQLIKDDLVNRYKKLSKDKKFKVTVYKNDEEYYFHIIVPSESERDNNYDVVLLFTYDEFPEYKYDNFLKRYFIKFFSNCPSFTYTFAQTFHQYGFLIDSLSNKYNSAVLDNQPIIRNPGQIISFEKSIYFACLFIQDSWILKNKMVLNQMAKPFDLKTVYSIIRSTDAIELEIKKINNRIKEEKKKKQESDSRKKSLLKKVTDNIKGKIVGRDKISSSHKIIPKKKISSSSQRHKKK